jgi:hypothetical protein
VLDTAASQFNDVLAAARPPMRFVELPSPQDAQFLWREQLSLAPPLQVIFAQLSAAAKVFGLKCLVRTLLVARFVA